MVDPIHITKFDRTDLELQELLLFCIAVAGKNAITTARLLDKFLIYAEAFGGSSHFQSICKMDEIEEVGLVMKEHGFGCYRVKSRGFVYVAKSGLNLRTCSVADLEKIPGVGLKTSRFFILHTRPNALVACLDTHVLKWLSYYTGYNVPRQTPPKKQYLELEQLFLEIARVMKTSPADLDLKIWNRQRGSDEKPLDKTASSKKT
jgi:thermostable 8-oxoguanine DNA glycosylase